MTIKEVEQALEIPRATIRYYEKENLINPSRTGNSYREYSAEDVATLKKIIILRKVGMSVADIEDFLNEDVSLQSLLEKNITELQEKMKELEGAINVCKIMQNKNEDINTFDEEYYWQEIRTEEKAGNKFLELVNDVVEYEKKYGDHVRKAIFKKKVIFTEFELINEEGEFIYSPKEAVLRALGSCLLVGVLWCVMDGGKLNSFIEGFFWPFICILIYSIFGLPVHLLGKKHPKAAGIIKKIGIGLAVALVVFLLLIAFFGEEA